MDFKSKKGRPFAAVLKLKENGNFEFKFVSRKSLATGEEAAPKVKKVKAKGTATKAKVVKKAKEPIL